MAKKIVSWAVLLFLFVPLIQSFGQLVQARMLELGESIWPRYAEIRIHCIASEINSLQKVEVSASDSALLEELDLGTDSPSKSKTTPKKEEATNTAASSVLPPMELSLGQKLYCGTERKLSSITIFAIDYIPMTMVVLLLVAGIVSTTRRYHIALKNPENKKEELASELSQIFANGILIFSAASMLPFSKGVDAQIQILWIVGLLLLSALNLYNIRNSEFTHIPKDQEKSRISEILLAIPLYCWMATVCGIYFTLIEYHPAGLAIYLQKLTAHATLYIQIGLYVWTGILLRDTSLGRRFFDLLKPWKLPAELLAVIVVIAAALPTAYSGASGIVVLALGATIFVELRRAGATQERALAATAMSGSLGVVLPPCLLVVIVASLNLDVTTDELFYWGWRVFAVSTTLFLVVSWFLRKDSWKIQPEQDALKTTWSVFKPFSLYILIAVVIVGVLVFGLNTHFDEHTAPYMLPIAMLALIYWDHKQSQKEHHPASGARDVVKISRTSYDTGSHLGALLMLMGLSACMGGVFERSNIINLFPTQLGSPLSAMIILTIALVIIGMLMDPYGAVILVSVTLYPIAKANGIHPLNFWMTALVSFELGYLTPPVALNHLLTKHVVREYLEKEPEVHHASFFARYERVIVPIIVLFLTLIVTAFGPILVQGWGSR
ncbi:transporter [Leptospira kmetyi]|uniref:TRAP transporter large permease subunit n=1 Tax=Leptospira kmetyi TaxID=408139 RepID=UPI000C298F7F|nr:TRAP transporter large permease subunit [Leptospira kmetyi]PJZ42968.1 transporter [Leptospira kmetyi]